MNLSPFTRRRKTSSRTLYARFFQNKKFRKQHAAANAYGEELEEEGINISRSLSIIFAIHIVAICMIFIHNRYFSDPSKPSAQAETRIPNEPLNDQLPVLSNGDRLYEIVKGDDYAIIAKKYGVDENLLREVNKHSEILPGKTLCIPEAKKALVIDESASPLAEEPKMDESEIGLVEILPKSDGANAQSTRPILQSDPSHQSPSGKTHTVKSGENLWRISNYYKVDQKILMQLNQITDPSKLKAGQVLKIP